MSLRIGLAWSGRGQAATPAGTGTGGAWLAALAGAAIVFVVGFAQPAAVHDAAHDARHTLALPCH